MVRRACAPALLLATALWPAAAGAQCRLALLLALDVSSSVDAAEDALQRQGVARALMAPAVRQAILAVPGEPVALAVYEWSGRDRYKLLLDWEVLDTPARIATASDTLARSERSHADYPTALGYAIGHASTLFRSAPPCLFRTLDISGDGISNDGFGPALAYQNFPLDDVTVNALTIRGHDAGLVTFYRDQVIRGPGAFVEIAEGFEDYERAMTRKLVRELGARVVGSVR